MRHIFVVNPVSGKGKNAKNYIPVIEKYIKEPINFVEVFIKEYLTIVFEIDLLSWLFII